MHRILIGVLALGLFVLAIRPREAEPCEAPVVAEAAPRDLAKRALRAIRSGEAGVGDARREFTPGEGRRPAQGSTRSRRRAAGDARHG